MSAAKDTIHALTSFRYWRYFIPSVGLAVLFAASRKAGQYLLELARLWVSGKTFNEALDTTAEVVFLMATFALKFLVLTLLSPMLSYLSEKIDEHYNGFPFKYTLPQFVWAIVRSVGVAIAALTVQIVLMVIFLVPAWLAGETYLVAAMVIITSFFLGFAFFDYSLERHKYGFFGSWRWFGRNLPQCFLVGVIFNALTYLPWQLGWYEVYYAGMGLLPPVLTIFATLIFTANHEPTR